MKAGRLTQLRSYLNKTFYQGNGIKWMIQTLSGEHVYCDKCGNYANGVAAVKTASGRLFNIPMCKNHLHEAFPEEEIVCPTTLPFERKPKVAKDDALRDILGEEITEGCYLDVKNTGASQVWLYEGELIFAHAGRIEKVRDFTSNEMEVVSGATTQRVRKLGIANTPQLEEDLIFHIDQLTRATEHLAKRRVTTPGLGAYHHTMKFTLQFLKDLSNELQRTTNTVQQSGEVR